MRVELRTFIHILERSQRCQNPSPNSSIRHRRCTWCTHATPSALTPYPPQTNVLPSHTHVRHKFHIRIACSTRLVHRAARGGGNPHPEGEFQIHCLRSSEENQVSNKTTTMTARDQMTNYGVSPPIRQGRVNDCVCGTRPLHAG